MGRRKTREGMKEGRETEEECPRVTASITVTFPARGPGDNERQGVITRPPRCGGGPGEVTEVGEWRGGDTRHL